MSEKIYVCKNCEYSTKTRQAMKVHLKSKKHQSNRDNKVESILTTQEIIANNVKRNITAGKNLLDSLL